MSFIRPSVPKPERDMRFSEQRNRRSFTALVGLGLTAAAQGESPTVGSDAETGERVAKLAPLHRTADGSTWLRRAVVKA